MDLQDCLGLFHGFDRVPGNDQSEYIAMKYPGCRRRGLVRYLSGIWAITRAPRVAIATRISSQPSFIRWMLATGRCTSRIYFMTPTTRHINPLLIRIPAVTIFPLIAFTSRPGKRSSCRLHSPSKTIRSGSITVFYHLSHQGHDYQKRGGR